LTNTVTHKVALAQSANKVLFFSSANKHDYKFGAHKSLIVQSQEYRNMFDKQNPQFYQTLWNDQHSEINSSNDVSVGAAYASTNF
jgi:hypothetical protein